MLTFAKYIELREQNTVGYHNDGPGSGFMPTGGPLLGSDFTGSEQSPTMGMLGHPLHLPSLDMGIPSITRTGRVAFIERNKNPIFILLSDGTKLYLSWDQFKRIEGQEPTVGRQMTVTFQRHPGDQSEMNSQIASCRCD
jgi:hypothetical protein